LSLRQIPSLDRRRMLQGSAVAGLAGLGGCATLAAPAPGRAFDGRPLAPLRARTDRLFDLTVCLRPFRAAGPRLDVERIGEATVVHNYGYGGSGWSLSWGGAAIAVARAMESGPREIAVVGCGAIGLTSAITAQRAGAKVTIYAKELLPQTRSARATGLWTPDSRIALDSVAGPAFADVWERMARTSFKTYRNYLGLPGNPVEWIDLYSVQETPRGQGHSGEPSGSLDFGSYRPRIRDLTPPSQLVPADAAPFDAPFVYRSEIMMFNIADYGHTLIADFLAAGGKVVVREFHAPAEIAALDEKVVINCPGYGGRALWKDETLVPVRGQIGWLIPQPEVNYGLYYKDVSVVPRRDGIVVQAVEGGDMKGYGDDHEVVDRAESERAVETLAELYRRFRPRG
jgi:glycine/D-amino acid oxidase-like deaminating enzyme